MHIEYTNNKVERYFTDMIYLKKNVGVELSKGILKIITILNAADKIAELFNIAYCRPEYLTADKNKISLRVNKNWRMLILVKASEQNETVDTIVIEGVCDYHGGKNNWIIP